MAASPERERELVRVYPAENGEHERYIAASGRAQLLLNDLAHSTMSDGPLLIRGETGTGKTLLARTAHALGRTAQGPLKIVSCAALSDGLIAEVLGPPTQREDASGTLLLDEVGELSPWSQAVLMQWLHSAAPARLIATTQRDLEALATAGQFSRELLASLGNEHVSLAPLRKRRAEIVPLGMHFLGLALTESNVPAVAVERDLLSCLERHPWHGNARELRNAMYRALALNDSGVLGLADLPERVRGGNETVTCE